MPGGVAGGGGGGGLWEVLRDRMPEGEQLLPLAKKGGRKLGPSFCRTRQPLPLRLGFRGGGTRRCTLGQPPVAATVCTRPDPQRILLHHV